MGCNTELSSIMGCDTKSYVGLWDVTQLSSVMGCNTELSRIMGYNTELSSIMGCDPTLLTRAAVVFCPPSLTPPESCTT